MEVDELSTLADYRLGAGYTQETFANELGVDRTTVGRWERGTQDPQPWQRPDLAQALKIPLTLLNDVLRRTKRQATARKLSTANTPHLVKHGDNGLPPEHREVDCRALRATSHMFVPVFLGADLLAAVIESMDLSPGAIQEVTCETGPVEHPDRPCQLYVFPWGVAVFHLTEELSLPTIARLAIWRRQTYRDVRAWITAWMRDVTASPHPQAHYVLSAYWVHEPLWSGTELETAMRLLSMPRVLLDRGGNGETPSLDDAESVEQGLIQEGFQDGRIDEFGIRGLSIGCASWAGVSYFPLAPARAIQVSDLVDSELLVQALWCYCHHIREQVEKGLDPVVAPEYGWRWMRAMRSRMTVARPQETAQHASMRTALLETSELGKHLTAAVELLRETNGE